MRINCRFCEEDIDVSEFDFARWVRGELIFCEECYEDYRNNINKVRRS